MKRYENDKSNVVGKLIKKYREKANLTKADVCRQLQLYAIYLDGTELHRMETGQMVIKDFELIGFCKVLDIDYNELKSLIEH